MGRLPRKKDRLENMRILYFSDSYAHNVMGTKRSIRQEVASRGHSVIYQDKARIPGILNLIKAHKPDQVWIAHSFALLSSNIRRKAGVPIVGFGFSDPNNFKENRLLGYNAYITNYYATYLKYKNEMPVFYNPTACDFRFHRTLYIEKDIDISFIGISEHPHFKDRHMRIKIIHSLMRNLDFKIMSYGKGWLGGNIEGMAFLKVINRSRIGLDIQDEDSPLAHRMLEYSACGTPVITREREEVKMLFSPDEEILTYKSYDDLKEKLIFYLDNPKKLEAVGRRAKDRCLREHDIKYRVDGILNFLDEVFQ